MALTKDFKDTIQARAQRDPAFRKALLQEGVECLLAGDVDTGKDCLSRKCLLLKSLRSFGSVGQLTHFRLYRLCQTEKRDS